MPVNKRRRNSSKAVFWEKQIKDWLDSDLPQSTYCVRHGLSQSAFSKWKTKLRPALKGKRNSYAQKSKYFKFTKLSDHQIETLMRFFVTGVSVGVTANAVGISEKSVYKHFDKLRISHLDGALIYPQLFFGAGMLVLLGPPPDYAQRLYFIKKLLHGSKGKMSDEKSSKNTLKNKISIAHKIMISHSLYEWTMPEIFLFRHIGYQIYYRNVYSKRHSLDSNRWDNDLLIDLIKNVHQATIARANWDYWATEGSYKPLLHEEDWNAIYHNRKMINFDVWDKQTYRDLKWFVRHHNIGDTRRIRRTYWDEFYPDHSSVDAAFKELSENWQKFKTSNSDRRDS